MELDRNNETKMDMKINVSEIYPYECFLIMPITASVENPLWFKFWNIILISLFLITSLDIKMRFIMFTNLTLRFKDS